MQYLKHRTLNKKTLPRLLRALSLALISLCVYPNLHAQSAQLQFIHNSADTSLAAVDIWVDAIKVADNLSFRSATSALTVNIDDWTDIHICDSASIDTTNSLVHWSDSIPDSTIHQFIVQGLSQIGSYTPFQAMELVHISNVTDSAAVEGNTDIRWINGITDGSNITVEEIKLGFGNMLQSFSYGDLAPNESYTTSNYRIEVRDGNTVLGQFEFDLSAKDLENRAVSLIWSGFATPENNADGAPIQLIAYETDGTRHLFAQSTARVQWIHNSPDPSLPAVDILINGKTLLSSLNFRAASGYLAIPSGMDWEIAVTKEGSNTTLTSSTLNLEADRSYVAVIAGNAETGFSVERPLNIAVQASRRHAQLGTGTDVIYFNGAPDFANARLFESSALNDYLFSSSSFGSFSGYNALPFTDYRLELLDEIDNSLFATYDFILSLYQLEGEAITLMTSGFRDTASNKNGPAIGLWFARAQSGLMIELPLAVGLQETKTLSSSVSCFPNPADQSTFLKSVSRMHRIDVYDSSGRRLQSFSPDANETIIQTSDWSRGIYFMRIRLDDGQQIQQKLYILH